MADGYINGTDLMNAEETLLDLSRGAKKCDPKEVTILKSFIAFANEKLKCLDAICQRNQIR